MDQARRGAANSAERARLTQERSPISLARPDPIYELPPSSFPDFCRIGFYECAACANLRMHGSMHQSGGYGKPNGYRQSNGYDQPNTHNHADDGHQRDRAKESKELTQHELRFWGVWLEYDRHG